MILCKAYGDSPDINDADADLISNRAAPAPKKHKAMKPIRINGQRSISTLLESLESRVRPGVTDVEFKDLFVRCECGLILTSRAFCQHVCQELVDVTGNGTDYAGDD